MTDVRRSLPSVDSLLRSGPGGRAAGTFGRRLLKHAVNEVLDEVRSSARATSDERPSDDEILARAIATASRISVELETAT